MLPNSQVKAHSPRVKISSGHITTNGNDNGKGRRRHSHFRNGCRLAALRGYTGAKLALEQGISPAGAALMSGSSAAYVRALMAVLESKDATLLNAVLTGRVPVLTAAAQVRALDKLLAAYAVATTETKAAFGRIAGIDNVFDNVVAPTITVAAE
jgi:hypothetical protein